MLNRVRNSRGMHKKRNVAKFRVRPFCALKSYGTCTYMHSFAINLCACLGAAKNCCYTHVTFYSSFHRSGLDKIGLKILYTVHVDTGFRMHEKHHFLYQSGRTDHKPGGQPYHTTILPTAHALHSAIASLSL